MINSDPASRKELSGWGDGGSVFTSRWKVDDLSNDIRPEVAERHSEEMRSIIAVMLTGLHLEDKMVAQRKYKTDAEETVSVEESLGDVILKRTLKKLSSLLN